MLLKNTLMFFACLNDKFEQAKSGRSGLEEEGKAGLME